MLAWDSELSTSILVPLVDANQKRRARLGRELLGSFLPGSSEANLERIAVELVDARHGLVLIRSILIPGIDRLGFATRIQRDNSPPPDTISGLERQVVLLVHRGVIFEVLGRDIVALGLHRHQHPRALKLVQIGLRRVPTAEQERRHQDSKHVQRCLPWTGIGTIAEPTETHDISDPGTETTW